jgi:hypothetical protein
MRRGSTIALLVVATALRWVACSSFGSEGDSSDAGSASDVGAPSLDGGTVDPLPPRDSGRPSTTDDASPPCDGGSQAPTELVYENIDRFELKISDCTLAAVPGTYSGELSPEVLNALYADGTPQLTMGSGTPVRPVGATDWDSGLPLSFAAVSGDAGLAIAIGHDGGLSIASRVVTYPPVSFAASIFGPVITGEAAPWLSSKSELYSADGPRIYRRATPTSLRPTVPIAVADSRVTRLAMDRDDTTMWVTRVGAAPLPEVERFERVCDGWGRTGKVKFTSFDSKGHRAVIAATADRTTLLVEKECNDPNPNTCCLVRAVFRP